ncbi:MAG: DUF255 domain-containing protein [Blastocatellia bacterium]|nr:DUF255 domain-containing protein [Blastocatellia bacterium]
MKKLYSLLLICLFLTQMAVGWAQPKPIQAGKTDEHAAKPGGIHWEKWSDDLFERAQRENKLVILDLEAIWCHWCHVMDEITYQDPDVIRLIQSKYIAVRVDQDSRPDLSNRYEDYGWPATILFDSKGKEISLQSGYIPPKPMARMLQAFIDDPTPGPSADFARKETFSESAILDAKLRKELVADYVRNFDWKYGSWGRGNHKFLDWDSVEYSMALARQGDKKAEQRARLTLKGEMNILDPAWGGVYQYSTGGVWTEPHFEKIMSHQAENMRIFALGYSIWKDQAYLYTATEIRRFLKTFLTSPEGAFYTSMDADLVQGEHSDTYFKLNDAERRKLGIPRIDKHVYSRENGWVIRALATLYSVTGEKQYLDDAVTAANWIVANRSLPGGGFRHDEVDQYGPFMSDNISMGQALIALYTVTANRDWLQKADATADFIIKNFSNGEAGPKAAGFITSKYAGKGARPKPQRDENVAMVRFANMLYHYMGKDAHKAAAEQAMRFVAAPEVADRRPTATPLLAEFELANEPVHITVVGSKDDPQAQALFKAAIAFPTSFKLVEWYDRKEGALPNAKVQFPELKSAAAFACSGERCSSPSYKPEDIPTMVARLK